MQGEGGKGLVGPWRAPRALGGRAGDGGLAAVGCGTGAELAEGGLVGSYEDDGAHRLRECHEGGGGEELNDVVGMSRRATARSRVPSQRPEYASMASPRPTVTRVSSGTMSRLCMMSSLRTRARNASRRVPVGSVCGSSVEVMRVSCRVGGSPPGRVGRARMALTRRLRYGQRRRARRGRRCRPRCRRGAASIGPRRRCPRGSGRRRRCCRSR